MNENLIEFNYILSPGMMQIANNVSGMSNTLHCYLPVKYQNQLTFTSLYVVAAHKFEHDSQYNRDIHIYNAPIGVVAMRETEASMIYRALFPDCNDASVYCELVRNCDNLEVHE